VVDVEDLIQVREVANFPSMTRLTRMSELAAALALIGTVTGCGVTVTENRVAYAEFKTDGLTSAQLMSGLSSRLVSMGYDIKHTDKDAGVVISEYRVVGRSEGNPPFDTYLQVRSTIEESKGGALVRLTPSAKSQNRLNLLASSEIPVVFYTGEPENVNKYIRKKGLSGMVRAHSEFEAVIQSIADFAKVPAESIHEESQSREVNSRHRSISGI
jgi:hypothetical protein